MSEQPKAIIRCCVYNHEPYIRDCLDGFVMQKTNFPFKAVVHDDASTDNSADIIREYAEKYPHIIEPIYETENQYSKRDGSLGRIMDAATLNRSPYIAYCEGDDYWIDPYKLQKQVDYMDAHPECTMTCSNVEIHTPNGIINDTDKRKSKWFFYEKSQLISTQEIINHAGHTCTLIIRCTVFDDYPIVCKLCHVGDYPLQIYAALKGTVYCFSENTAVYRYLSIGSWTAKQRIISKKERAKCEISIIQMLNEVNLISNKKYEHQFESQIYNYSARAIRYNTDLAYTLSINYGYIFIKYPIASDRSGNKLTFGDRIHLFFRQCKYFPFKIGSFHETLKIIGWKKRLYITLLCCLSYLRHQFYNNRKNKHNYTKIY